MGYAGKILVGAFIGVGAIAAAPFTGGGSVLAGASLATSLLGAGGVAAVASIAGGAAGAAVQKAEDNSKEKNVRNAKTSSFEDGIREGKKETVDEIMKFADFYLATTALSYYFARCDGEISEEEELEIEHDLDAIIKNIDIPTPVRQKLVEISTDENMTFDDVKMYLNKISIETLRILEKDVDEIISASGGICEAEKIARQAFMDYLEGREIKHFENICSDATIESYYDNILTADDINRAVEAYGAEFDEINAEFAERTMLTKVDCAFLVLAIALQCTRQYITQFKPTQDETATKKDDEAKYNKKTSKLEESDDTNSKQGGYYFAKFENICADTSVPYDKIAGSKKFDLGLGGTTHRYKTIGHDPILGYIFGTMNILTNTLTAWDFNSYHIRNHSVYSNANTLKALDSMMNRVKNDLTAVAAALIKQTIHIKSDMYTSNKIPFPVLSEISPELSMTLSKYGLNFTNALTVGKQASLSIAINMIIAMLHRLLMSKDEECNEKLYEVRTRKIILYSNIIATSSNILYVGLSENIKKLDVGGFAVTMYRLFSDPKFIDKVKYEFINSNLTAKYEEKYGEISMYYSE